jgi:hypothetical protein
MDTQSQNMQEKQEPAQNNEQDQQQEAGNEQKHETKKYHRSSLYASTLIRDSVDHVKPHNHSGLDL